MKLFSIHDSKAEFYMNPMTFKNAGEANRAFETTVNQPESQFGLYPSDFTLVEIGVFEDETGRIIPHETPIILCNATDFNNKK